MLNKNNLAFATNTNSEFDQSACLVVNAGVCQISTRISKAAFITNYPVSRIVRKRDYCLGENKGADQ